MRYEGRPDRIKNLSGLNENPTFFRLLFIYKIFSIVKTTMDFKNPTKTRLFQLIINNEQLTKVILNLKS